MIVLEGVTVLKDLIDCVYKRSECNGFGKRFLFDEFDTVLFIVRVHHFTRKKKQNIMNII